MRTVLVTGATGHVGYQLATRLRDEGWQVRALIRSPEQVDLVKGQGWEPVRGDLAEPNSLQVPLGDVDFVLHCAAIGGADNARCQVVNVDATRALAIQALQAKVHRFVHMSTISVHGNELPKQVDEESPLATTDPEPYCSSKALGELALGKIRAEGLETVVLRPGMVTNVVRSQWGNEMVDRIRTRGWPKDVHPDDVMPWVHTQNLAEMVVLALTHPAAANETFLAIDRNVAFSEFFVPIANALGQSVLVPDRPPQISECRVGKIAAKLGYRPIRSFEETMDGLVALAKAPH
ncbi:MAG: NAD-dependent epimerase/dehydratase family protein [Thermoplasmata archaeon]